MAQRCNCGSLFSPSPKSANVEVKPNHCFICLFNIRSIENKLSELEVYCTKYRPSVLCLVETWLKPDQIPSIQNYKYVSSYNRIASRGGGCGIWVADHVVAGVVDVTAFVLEGQCEVCACVVRVLGAHVTVFSVYRLRRET